MKIKLVFLREFMQRIKSKGFILSTLLAPFGLVVFLGLTIYSVSLGMEEDSNQRIAVKDETGGVASLLKLPSSYTLILEPATEEALRKQVLEGKLDGYLFIPSDALKGDAKLTYVSGGGGGINKQIQLQNAVEDAIQEARLKQANIPDNVKAIFAANTRLEMKEITAFGEKADTTGALTGIAFAMSFLIYMMMFIYGSLVMQSVIEEKLNRVMEVLISSVRPFELLMGKVLGMGALGLVQMLVWSALSMAMTTAMGPLLLLFFDPAKMNLPDTASQQQVLDSAGFAIPELSPMLFVWFVLFFIGGYLLYASYFAAVGSAVESPQDAQQLMMPVTFLIIIPMLFINTVIMNPDGTTAKILSMIPFFSPILMPARIAATDVPFWEPAVAFVLLVFTFIGAIWVSARIYRIGVLSYGKKPSIRDLVKWIRTA
ncbi:MAG: ABC transporter permease [Bacteroidetes Order II. Incertae sedis bacterium]|nr:ABC transporter permease [Bacteroidetes Order II. bacterium]